MKLRRLSGPSSLMLSLLLILSQTASAIAKPSLAKCDNLSPLQARWQELTAEIAVDNQVLANFGFEKTVQNFEEWSAEAQKGEQKRLDAKLRELWKSFADYDLEVLEKHINDMSPATAEKLVAFARSLHMDDEPLFQKVLASAYGDGAAREVLHAEVAGFLKGLGTVVSLAFDAADASQGEILYDGLTAIVALVPATAPAALLLGGAKWIYGLVYDEKRALDKKIRELTEMTEGQLRDLKTTTLRLREHVEERGRLKVALANLSDCPTNLAPVRKASHSTGAVAAGILVGGAAIAGGVVLGGQLGGKGATSQGACISTRNCIVSTFGHGCDCAGDANGRCDWTGPVTGLGQGGCGTGGAPCAQGLSCNNGVCEDRNGRCPF